MSTSSTILVTARRFTRLSQAAFARRALVPRSVLNAYERANREPGADALAKLVDAAGLELRLVPESERPDPERAARILEQVLQLAEALPYRPRRSIAATPFQ